MNSKEHHLDELDPAVLSEMRNNALLFLKLDLGYLFSAGALVAALQITRSEFFDLSPIWIGPGIALLCIAVLDALIFDLLSQGWLYAKTGWGKRRSQRVTLRLISWQIGWHVMFFMGLVGYLSGFVASRQSHIGELRNKVVLQESVEAYQSRFGKIPESIHDLSVDSPKTRKAINALKSQGLKIEPDGKGHYKITLGGRDSVLGTEDDDVITHEIQLRLILEKMEDFI